ncbi:Trans-3-hydroxy-L-proline dehydratase [Amphibalanus amphitrite]|uniref:trans-L-3-hydroxyproline dehydratase n=1 Tax=Amphibalanus amphitrite TaxID=1232801 RepID=A0A6A4WGW6_AMPAM|nr:trans-3-hydroxy-L-proline dehydratase-like [Amphibalanus amphitrite]XP_043230160.1 trans-3-hydroxy-L-proline dehydratase-like [Amphibalanus amphitrite]KAF0302052.1 Trans-3-hydroxy-L-proline dehydratase [Amphibalanus amphitrite]
MEPVALPGQPVKTVEMHTGGEPLRIVVSGLPPIAGATLLDKRRFCREQLDRYRRVLMGEPRGHRDMYGAYLVTPDSPHAHMGALFLHNEGYSTMCGHGVLALARYLVDEEVVPRAAEGETAVNIQCPCGLVRAWLAPDNTARFLSVPAFVLHSDLRMPLPNGGECRIDICYGGAFYAMVRAADVGLAEDGVASAVEYLRIATQVRNHISTAGIRIRHPDSADLGYLYGVVFGNFAPLSQPSPPPSGIRLVTVFADGQLDRSPCGSATTACCALLHASGHLPAEHSCTFTGLAGSEFTARVKTESECGGRPAAVVEVAGKAYYTGRGEFTVEPDDPLGDGFLIR